MSKPSVKIQFLSPNSTAPFQASQGAAGIDLPAAVLGPIWVLPGGTLKVSTGLAIELPEGYCMDIRSRSGLSFKYGVEAFHGLIDSDYRGELQVLLKNSGTHPFMVANGDRIAQGVIRKIEPVELIVVESLSRTARGANGFGSTGV